MSLFKENPPDNTVGIVIPMQDNLDFFKLAFHSLLSFTGHPYMLTVVDNMSSFTTKKYLRNIQGTHDIKVMQYNNDFNYSAEINIAMKHMFSFPSVKYGVALNSDVVLEPRWLSTLLRTVDSHENIGIVGPVTNIAIEPQQRKRAPMIWSVEYVSGFCMLFKRKVFEELGGFDERYIGGCYEDQDFCRRAAEKTWSSVVCGATYVHHFWRATRDSYPKVDRNVQDNRKRFIEKFPPISHDHTKLMKGG